MDKEDFSYSAHSCHIGELYCRGSRKRYRETPDDNMQKQRVICIQGHSLVENGDDQGQRGAGPFKHLGEFPEQLGHLKHDWLNKQQLH